MIGISSHRFGFACLMVVSLATSITAKGQQSRGKASEEVTTNLRAIDRKINAAKEGMVLPEFTAHTIAGSIVTNNSLRGKVSLLVFWDPWCNCFNPDALGALPEIAKQQKDFQILSMMSDTGRLAEFKTQHVLGTPVLILPDVATMRALNGNNGIPSCVLVDREGYMVKISAHLHADIFDEQSFTEKIRELLMF